MGQEALSIQANTFQFFTRNPRGSQVRISLPRCWAMRPIR
jgi:hypothetical protein